MFFKKKEVPYSNTTREIKVPQTWMVYWDSYEKSISMAYVKRKAQAFLSKEQALEFVTSLKNARKLLCDSELTYTIEEQ